MVRAAWHVSKVPLTENAQVSLPDSGRPVTGGGNDPVHA